MPASLRIESPKALKQFRNDAPADRRLRVLHARTAACNDPDPGGMCMRVVPGTAAATEVQPRSMDADAYNRVVEDHSDALFRYAVKHLRDRDEAKDIVQESFLRLWMRLDSVTVTGARSYLFTTVHNLIVDRSRRNKHMTRYEVWHDDVRTTHQPKAGLKDRIDGALARLSPLQRSLVLLRDLEGHSYNDIASITGLDMTKVKVYLFRARKAMQSHLGELSTLI